MKKNILSALAVCALAMMPALAQTKSQPSLFIDRSAPDHVIEFGVHVGEGLSTIYQNYSKTVPGVADFNLTPGNFNTIGASVEVPFRNYLALGTGLEFAINNYHWSMTLLDASAGTLNTLYTRNHYHSLSVPVYLSTRFNVGKYVHWINELGVYLDYGIGSGTSKTHAYASSTNSLGQSQVTEMNYNHKYYKDDQPIINGVTTNDYGLHLATGLRFRSHFSFKAVFHAGARNLAINYGVLGISNRTVNLAFKAGYIF